MKALCGTLLLFLVAITTTHTHHVGLQTQYGGYGQLFHGIQPGYGFGYGVQHPFIHGYPIPSIFNYGPFGYGYPRYFGFGGYPGLRGYDFGTGGYGENFRIPLNGLFGYRYYQSL